jgi:hypothetical protein
MGNLAILRQAIPSAQVSSLTTGSITLPSAKGAFILPPKTWEWIATSSPSGVTTTTFSGIPTDYHTLKVIGVANTSGDSIINFTLNGTTGYSEYAKYGSVSTTASSAGFANTSNQFRRSAATSDVGNYGASFTFTVFNANSTTSYKPMTIWSNYGGVSANEFTWSDGQSSFASAVTSIKIATGNSSTGANPFISPSKFVLYGMKEGTAL